MLQHSWQQQIISVVSVDEPQLRYFYRNEEEEVKKNKTTTKLHNCARLEESHSESKWKTDSGNKRSCAN